MKKLNQLWFIDDILIEKKKGHGYSVFTSDASTVLFLFSIPIIGNLLALGEWIKSLFRVRYIQEEKHKQETKLIFSSAHKKTQAKS